MPVDLGRYDSGSGTFSTSSAFSQSQRCQDWALREPPGFPGFESVARFFRAGCLFRVAQKIALARASATVVAVL